MNGRDAAPGGGFRTADGAWTYAGSLTFANAAAVFAAAQREALPSGGTIDLSGLTQADSAALAVMLSLKRRAAREGAHVAFVAVPPGVTRLARAYGVLDVLAG